MPCRIIHKSRLPPTRYRYRGNIRLGFRGKRVVEVAKVEKERTLKPRLRLGWFGFKF